MKSEQCRIVDDRETVNIPCVNWQVDEEFPVRIQQRPAGFPLVRITYIGLGECPPTPVVIVKSGCEIPSKLNPDGGNLC
ncbi:MAG TPA: hypothetical protein VN281_05895 [Verrucomicrobiae bacterium]|nr:hypothetical protein [Verrucomicrobiae bacterium]